MIKTALIVDDSMMSRMTLRRLLEKLGIVVQEAESVAAARLLLERPVLPHIIFMDLLMPGVDGFEGTAEIRRNPRTSRLPVIIYSGNVSDESKQHARKVGATGFLRKPVDERHLDAILTKINEALNKYHAQ